MVWVTWRLGPGGEAREVPAQVIAVAGMECESVEGLDEFKRLNGLN
jgi:hypothetical protein